MGMELIELFLGFGVVYFGGFFGWLFFFIEAFRIIKGLSII